MTREGHLPIRVNAFIAATGYLLALVVIVLTPPIQAILLALTLPFDRNRRIVGRFSRLAGAMIGRVYPPWRLRVEGRWPGRGPYVVVANHQSLLDILLLSRLPREMKWVAKESLFKVPWLGWVFRLSGDIPVRRGDAESGGAALTKARQYLDRGMHVMIFPEGTRSAKGSLLPFKSGAFRLAIEAGVPVLPVAVSGTAQGMPKGNPWVRPCRAYARILEPIPTAGLGTGDVARLRDEVRARIAAALPPSEVGATAAPPVTAGPAAAPVGAAPEDAARSRGVADA
jgi:1-acyl-sn-glycerol-3-phosphate acyltransferase